jgi:hypothetical protein
MLRQLITVMVSIGSTLAAPQVVLKLDDMNVVNGQVPERWQTLTRFAEERRIKTSIGIIGNSLEADHPEYIAEFKRLAGTIDILPGAPEIPVWLEGDAGNPAGKFVVRMINNVIVEKPVHRPNFDDFIKGYEALKGNQPPVLILQGHPNS